MRILFMTGHFAFLRHFESVLRMCAERGHSIHLAADKEDAMGGLALVQQLSREYPSITYGWTPEPTEQKWRQVARSVRTCTDYLRYLEPMYAETTHLRERMARRTPKQMVRFANLPLVNTRFGRAWLRATLFALERAVPTDPAIDAFIREQRPDLVLFTPLIGLASDQLDELKSAQALGLPTVLCVTSWDHLSSKALIRNPTDRVIVWNDVQKDEAVTLHGLDPESILVTGAQTYDQWFGWNPSTTREEFCAHVGLSSHRPFFLYVCSAIFKGTGDEVAYARQWAERVRTSDDKAVRGAGILIRPHPARVKAWRGVSFDDLGNIVIWPRESANPIDAPNKRNYFDSLYHCAAVVGINTSSLIEAGIVGRPVHTILAPELAESQTRTPHFHYLMDVDGGLLHVARDLDEHVIQLSASLANPEQQAARGRRFVQRFVRPHGLDTAATPLFVDALESMQGVAVRRASAPESRTLVPLRLALGLASNFGRRRRRKPRPQPMPAEVSASADGA